MGFKSTITIVPYKDKESYVYLHLLRANRFESIAFSIWILRPLIKRILIGVLYEALKLFLTEKHTKKISKIVN